MKPMLDAPIPGQSLTSTPRNSPWENPPLYDTAEETLGFYLDKLDDDELIDDLFFVMEQGLPVASIVDGMTSTGVMEGYHTFDVKMLIAPVLHEHLVTLADAAGISYKEQLGPSKEEQMSEKMKKRALILIEKGMGGKPSTPSAENVEEATELLAGTDSPEEEAIEQPAPMGASKPAGLIPRRA